MSANKYLLSNDLYYSTVYGGGIYTWDGQEKVQDPLCGDSGESHLSPLLTNIITGELYFMKRIQCNKHLFNSIKRSILNPPDRQYILWPCDMILLSETQENDCSMFVSQEYSENITSINQRKGNCGLLFPYGGYPKMVSGVRKLAQINQRNWEKSEQNWKNPEIRSMAKQILIAIDNVNRCGYAYEDIHLSRFFFLAEGRVFLNYSNLIYSLTEFATDSSREYCSVSVGEYPIEFAEPAYVSGKQKCFDFDSQNYSISALLFYLFFGRYCYDGRLLTGYVDDSEQSHYVKFRDYHKMPVFIFDPNDRQNALGAFDEEQQVVDLWNECPDMVKELFINTLSQQNAERSNTIANPPPSTWLKCFSYVGWDK